MNSLLSCYHIEYFIIKGLESEADIVNTKLKYAYWVWPRQEDTTSQHNAKLREEKKTCGIKLSISK